jgi:hypothetical protein
MSKKILANIFLLIFLRALLDLAYVYFVAPLFEYAGFKFSLGAGQYAISWIFYLVLIPFVPYRLSRVSDAVFVLVATAIMAPLTSMYGLSGEDFAPVVIAELSLAIVFLIVKFRSLKVFRLPVIANGELLAVLLSSAVVGVVALHFLLSGVHLNVELLKVYEFRRANEGLAANDLFAYLNPWAYQVFNLFLIAICLMRGRYLAVVGLLFVQVFLFAASQQKSVLFAPLLILGVWWYLRRSSNLLIIPVALIGMVASALLAFYLSGNVTFPSIVIRRLLFVPARLDFAYYSFFTTHPKMAWGDSFWMPFAQNPYPYSMPYVIGNYLGSPDMHANNGYVSSGFAQAGIFGVLIYTILLGYMLKFVDKESSRLNSNWFGVGLFIIPFITIWLASDLATSMLTHGFLMMVVLLGLVRRSDSQSGHLAR